MVDFDQYIRIGPFYKHEGVVDYFLRYDLYQILKKDIKQKNPRKWRLMSYCDAATIYKEPKDFLYFYPIYRNLKIGNKKYPNMEMISWLAENMGTPQTDWLVTEGKLLKHPFGTKKGKFTVVAFKNKSHALRFKLTWEEQIYVRSVK